MIPPGVISFPVIPPHESHGAGALKSEFTWRDHFPRGGITECTWRDYFLLIFIIGKTFRLYTKERAVYMKSSKLPAVNDVFEQRMISLELNVNKSEN